jgi:hypothetical protein
MLSKHKRINACMHLAHNMIIALKEEAEDLKWHTISIIMNLSIYKQMTTVNK